MKGRRLHQIAGWLEHNPDRAGLRSAQREVIVMDTDLNGIAKRRCFHDPDARAGHDPHFHQTQTVLVSSLNRRYAGHSVKRDSV